MKLQTRRIWSQFKSLPWERQILWSAGLLAFIPILASLVSPWSSTKPEDKPNSPRQEYDTFIPKGFVLVPIEVQNFESLDSILGQFAMVDLFQGRSPERAGQGLVARNVRLLRAPHNPSHFAVLVPESQVDQILRFGDSFVVAIKRRTKSGTEFVKERTSRKIIYEGG